MSDVNIRSGDLSNFSWNSTSTPNTTVNQPSNPIYKESPWTTFQAIVSSATFGALTATVAIQGSNDVFTGTGFVINNTTTTSGSGVVTVSQNLFAGGTEQLNDAYSPAVSVGMLVVGPGIPVGAYVATVTNTGSITLSSNATVSATGVSLKFFNTNWATTVLGTITLSGTTSATAPTLTDGFTSVSTWKFVRAVVTNVTGTGATVSVVAGL